jgi:hypothetical protein
MADAYRGGSGFWKARSEYPEHPDRGGCRFICREYRHDKVFSCGDVLSSSGRLWQLAIGGVLALS